MQNSFLPEGRLYTTAENTGYIRNEAGLRLALQSNKTLEGIASSCSRDFDLRLDLGGVTGIIPYVIYAKRRAAQRYSGDNARRQAGLF